MSLTNVFWPHQCSERLSRSNDVRVLGLSVHHHVVSVKGHHMGAVSLTEAHNVPDDVVATTDVQTFHVSVCVAVNS